MNLTLPQRIYLISYDPAKNDFTAANIQFRGQRLRAAALIELLAAGLVDTEDGMALRLGAAPQNDAFLAEVWGQVPADKPKKWIGLVHGKAHKAEAWVRAQLLAASAIQEPNRRPPSLLAKHKVFVTHSEQVLALRETIRRTVIAGSDPATVPFEDLATAVFCTEADSSILFDRQERRAHKKALTAFAERLDDTVPGLRGALLDSILSHRAVGGGWS